MKKLSVMCAACVVLFAGRAAEATLILNVTFDDSEDVVANSGTATTVWESAVNVNYEADGRFGGAGSFSAATPRSSLYDHNFNAASLDAFSLSLHVKTANTGNWTDFISVGTASGVAFVLERNGSNGGIYLYNIGGVGGAASDPLGYTGVVVNDGAWHHYGFTVGDNILTLYVDGENRGSTAYTGSGAISGIQIGGRFQDVANRQISGLIDDVAIFDETLSDGQMALLANGPAQIPEPAAGFLMLLGGLIFVRRHRRR